MTVLAFLRQGYEWAPRLRAGSQVVQTRLWGPRVTVLGGPDGAQLFYDQNRFERAGAVPRPVLKTLFGVGGVQGLDGPAHRWRKELFLQVTADIEGLVDDAAARWVAASDRWVTSERVVLFDEAIAVFGAAVFEWAGVPVSTVTAERWAFELAVLVDGFGNVLPAHLRARRARKKADRWAGALIEAVRAGRVQVPEGCAVALVAWHRDADGALLPPQVAAVELINVLRPTIAVAWYVAFAALVLDGEWRHRVLVDDAALQAFCLEVRRVCPIAPVLGARVRADFSWHGVRFRRGQLALLDVYGTDMEQGPFDPSRFVDRSPGPYDYLPQGGGDRTTGHRCPGEGIAQALLAGAVRMLAGLEYELPPQDLSVPLNRMPTRPRSGVVLRSVSRARPPVSSET